MPDFRWSATIKYRSVHGETDVDHQFEELEELHDIVEAGPDWNSIIDIKVTLLRNQEPEAVMEESMRLANGG